MKKGLALLAAAASLAAIGAPAAAQETTFSGPWISGVAGYDINKTGSTRDVDDQNVDQTMEGVVYGVGLGFDADLGNMVVGAEAELTKSTADSEDDPVFGTQNFGIGGIDSGRDIYVGGRVGFKAMPETLIYAKGGYSFGRYNYIGTDGTTNYDRNIDVDGWRAGAGIEQKLGTNAFAKLEYRYTNYSEGEIDFEAENVADGDQFNVDLDRHQIVAGVGWRF